MIIETADGENFSIEVRTSWTIRDVKRKIRDITCLSLDQQYLAAQGLELEDHVTLSDYGIDNTCTIQLLFIRYKLQRITVKTEDGGRFTIDVELSDTIKEVKQMIQATEGIPLDEQLLVINDEESDDQRTMSYYNIDDDTAIHLIRMCNVVAAAVHSPAVPSGTASNAQNSSAPLSAYYVACRDNDVRKLRELLSTLSVADMNRLEPNGSTGLHVACFRGHPEIVQLLLEKDVSRSIMNRFHCLPYDEAASPEIKRLFEGIPGKDRFVANSGRVEWLAVAENASTMSARQIEAVKQSGAQQFESSVQQIRDNYIKTSFNDVEKYAELLGFFNTALRNNDPGYLVKAYTAETGFYNRLNLQLASNTAVGATERRLYVGILAFNPYFDPYRYTGDAHRGMRLTEDDLREYTVDKKVMTKSFLSATTNKDEAKAFVARVKRHNINGHAVKTAVICTYIIRNKQTSLDVHQLSEYPKENEVLVFPYSVFTVTSVEQSSQTDGDDMTEITLTQC